MQLSKITNIMQKIFRERGRERRGEEEEREKGRREGGREREREERGRQSGADGRGVWVSGWWRKQR